jgi:hypothetical protein
MVSAWASHGSPSSTLSKDVGRVVYSIASPDLATRPTICPFQGSTWPRQFPLFLFVILSFAPRHFFPCPPHRIPRVSGDLPASTQGALKRAVSSLHSLAVLFPPGHVWPYSPLVRLGFLPWLTDSCIPNRFHAGGLLIALMMEAARTSETLVNFYQTTQRYNPEDSHLRAGISPNRKSWAMARRKDTHLMKCV